MFDAFKKNQTDQVKQPSQTLGDDFDVFPEVCSENGEKYHYENEPEPDLAVQPEPEKPAEEEEYDPERGMNGFQRSVYHLSEKKWKTIQIIIGIVIGVAACVALVIMTRGANFSAISIIAAAVIAAVIPNVLENLAKRPVPFTRKFVLFTVLVGFAAYLIYGFVINPGYFEALEITLK